MVLLSCFQTIYVLLCFMIMYVLLCFMIMYVNNVALSKYNDIMRNNQSTREIIRKNQSTMT